MASSYDAAVTALYQAGHESFVAERQRLAAELKAGGDKAGAARLGKLARPTISAWAVNQLWWQARGAFEAFFESAGQLRAGQLAASAAHRKALAGLTARAQKLLSASGHAASEATLRRVAMTLSGLAAAGGFDPELPGALTKDRAPPGFEAFGIGTSSDDVEATSKKDSARGAAASEPKGHSKRAAEGDALETKRRDAAEAKRAREAEAAERARIAKQRAKRAAERRELELTLRTAKAELRTRERARDHAAQALTAAEHELDRAAEAVAALEATEAAAARLDGAD